MSGTNHRAHRGHRERRGQSLPRLAFHPLVPLCSLCALWFILSGPSKAAEYEQKQGNAAVRLQADKVEGGRVEIRLSDEIHLTVSVEGSSTLEVQPVQSISTASDWQLSWKSVPERTPFAAGRVRWLQTFHFYPLKAGELSLALAPLRFREAPDADRWEEVTWQPIPVRVTTEIYRADMTELRDIAPPEELPPAPSWRVPLTWAGMALVLLLLLLNGWALLWRRGRRDAALPPDQWALQELRRLHSPARGTEKEVEAFYTQVSDVMRKYLELRFHLPAPEQTTPEFLEAMRRSPDLTPEHQALLRGFLERCDLVKFARAASSVDECHWVAAMAHEFVEQTAKISGADSL